MEPSSCAGINSPCRIIALIAITLSLGDLDRHKIRRIVHQCLSGLIRFILHSCCSFSLVNRVSTIAYFDLKVKPLFSLASNESWKIGRASCREMSVRVDLGGRRIIKKKKKKE